MPRCARADRSRCSSRRRSVLDAVRRLMRTAPALNCTPPSAYERGAIDRGDVLSSGSDDVSTRRARRADTTTGRVRLLDAAHIRTDRNLRAQIIQPNAGDVRTPSQQRGEAGVQATAMILPACRVRHRSAHARAARQSFIAAPAGAAGNAPPNRAATTLASNRTNRFFVCAWRCRIRDAGPQASCRYLQYYSR